MRRGGGVPPIVTVLVTISAIVAASLVAWFMFTTTRGAAQQPIIEVTAAYTTGSTLAVTVANLGTQAVTVSKLDVSCTNPGSTTPISGSVSLSQPATVQPGARYTFTITSLNGGALQDGASCAATLTLSNGAVSLGFKVVKP